MQLLVSLGLAVKKEFIMIGCSYNALKETTELSLVIGLACRCCPATSESYFNMSCVLWSPDYCSCVINYMINLIIAGGEIGTH